MSWLTARSPLKLPVLLQREFPLFVSSLCLLLCLASLSLIPGFRPAVSGLRGSTKGLSFLSEGMSVLAGKPGMGENTGGQALKKYEFTLLAYLVLLPAEGCGLFFSRPTLS